MALDARLDHEVDRRARGASRTELKPACVSSSVSRAKPTWLPRPSPPSWASDAGVQTIVDAAYMSRPSGWWLSSGRSAAAGSTSSNVPPGSQRLAHVAGRADRVAHVVQAVEQAHEVVGAGEVVGPGDLERDPVAHARLGRPRRARRRSTRRGSRSPRPAVRLRLARAGSWPPRGRSRRRRPGRPHRAASTTPSSAGHPVVDQARAVAGAEEPLGAGEQAVVVLVPADALAGAEGLGGVSSSAQALATKLESAEHERRRVLVGEQQRVLGRQGERAGVRGRR